MSSTRQERERLHQLLMEVVDGRMTEAQTAELNDILQRDAGARRFYARHMAVIAALHELA